MALIVQKFGGSSVADIERIQNVARIIMQATQQGHSVVAVVSAMYGETDRLIKLSQLISGTHWREYDALLATGEQTSAALLSMALASIGIPARSFTGAQLGIRTNNHHSKAQILNIETDLLQSTIASKIVPVVAGFQGVSDEGDITTLGRGGSDITAVAIAAFLEADECQIYTDVDGVYTSDPKIVPTAKRLSKITFDEMMELSSLGAKIMQSRSMKFAGKYKVPVRILSSLSEGTGTLITYETQPSEQPLVSGIAFERNQSKITVQRIPERPGLASYILGALNEIHIELDMIVQSAPNAENLVDFSFTLNRNDYQQALNVVEQIAKELVPAKVIPSNELAKVSLVGIGMRSHAGIASKMLSALGREGINIYLINATEIKISAIIDEKYLDLAARVLHAAFELGAAARSLPG